MSLPIDSTKSKTLNKNDILGQIDQFIFNLDSLIIDVCRSKNKMDIVEIAINNPRFSTLVNALQAANLVDTLKGKGPFTVFAPTNDAFNKLPENTLNSLLQDEKKLTEILSYHIVYGKIESKDLKNGQKIKTVLGKDLTINFDMIFKINDAKLLNSDVQAENGIIHIIDSVMIPPAGCGAICNNMWSNNTKPNPSDQPYSIKKLASIAENLSNIVSSKMDSLQLLTVLEDINKSLSMINSDNSKSTGNVTPLMESSAKTEQKSIMSKLSNLLGPELNSQKLSNVLNNNNNMNSLSMLNSKEKSNHTNGRVNDTYGSLDPKSVTNINEQVVQRLQKLSNKVSKINTYSDNAHIDLGSALNELKSMIHYNHPSDMQSPVTKMAKGDVNQLQNELRELENSLGSNLNHME
jgi:uncharacterized surface protein with fasciclin (FAS1) repeats